MTVGDHINIHGSIISYNIVKNEIRFKYTWVHKNDQNVLYALSSNYLSDKRRGKIRRRRCQLSGLYGAIALPPQLVCPPARPGHERGVLGRWRGLGPRAALAAGPHRAR